MSHFVVPGTPGFHILLKKCLRLNTFLFWAESIFSKFAHLFFLLNIKSRDVKMLKINENIFGILLIKVTNQGAFVPLSFDKSKGVILVSSHA